MRALVFSDVHGEMDRLRELVARLPRLKCDLGLFCGDIVRGKARASEYNAAREQGREPSFHTPEIEAERGEDYALYAEFYAVLRPVDFRIFAVPGNMDAPEGRFIAAALGAEGMEAGVESVHRFAAKLGDWVIAGIGGQITEATREEIYVLMFPRWEAEHAFGLFECIEGSRIMVLHTPPLGEVVDLDGHKHKGCQVVNDLIHHWRPSLAVCGHSHDSPGQEMIGNTLVVNPGALKNGHFATVDLESKEVRLLEL